MAAGVHTGPGEGERFENDVRVALIKCALPDTTVIEFSVVGDGYPGVDPHTHDDETDAFYVLEGELELTLGEETFLAGPGTFVAAPPGVRHGFKVPPGSRVRFLNIHAPGGFEHAMRRMNAQMGPRDDYDALVDDLLARHPAVERSQMMGMPCVKCGGKLALGFVGSEGAVVFKLPDPDEREAALALDGAHLFDPSGAGRPFKEWVVVPPVHAEAWEHLAESALETRAV